MFAISTAQRTETVRTLGCQRSLCLEYPIVDPLGRVIVESVEERFEEYLEFVATQKKSFFDKTCRELQVFVEDRGAKLLERQVTAEAAHLTRIGRIPSLTMSHFVASRFGTGEREEPTGMRLEATVGFADEMESSLSRSACYAASGAFGIDVGSPLLLDDDSRLQALTSVTQTKILRKVLTSESKRRNGVSYGCFGEYLELLEEMEGVRRALWVLDEGNQYRKIEQMFVADELTAHRRLRERVRDTSIAHAAAQLTPLKETFQKEINEMLRSGARENLELQEKAEHSTRWLLEGIHGELKGSVQADLGSVFAKATEDIIQQTFEEFSGL